MKLNLAFTFHYIIFISMIVLLAPAKNIYAYKKADEIKTKKKQQITKSNDTTELLPGEIFFRY